MVLFWHKDRILAFLLDSDAAAGDNVNAAVAIDKSLRKTDPIKDDGSTETEQMFGLTTDAGGGGTREGLATEMAKFGRVCDLYTFLAAACALHAMNRIMQSPCEKFLGEGGVGNGNLMQMLCTCHALQKEHEMKEWRLIWKHVTDSPFGEKFQEPACTRWEHTETACVQFVPKIKGFQKLSSGATNTEKSTSQRNKVASDFHSLLKEKALITLSCFPSSCHNGFWLPHFS